jgi:tRNA pseudouridine55 synthase
MEPAPRRARRRVDGVLLVDKPAGMTSNGALQAARRLLDAEKAGHTGTLDPFATGLLPLCFGEATKFAQTVLDAAKAYVATVRFGVTTATGDIDGDITAESPVTFDRAALEAVLPRFRGTIAQVPPMHSALKRDGRAYYDYARRGITLERAPREVDIARLALVDWTPPRATLEITCGKGTYVRVLAEDLGAALGCGAHLEALRRTAAAGFDVRDAVTLDALARDPAPARDARLLPVASLLAGMPALALAAADAVRLRNGQAIARDVPEGRYRALDGTALLGVVRVAGGLAHAERLCRTDVAPVADSAAGLG